MRKRLAGIASVFLAIIMSFSICIVGCFGSNASQEYTIQYSDEAGTHQLTVTAGMPYSLESIPVKKGYMFTGLFDAEVGGKQYVSANGSSLSPYTDGKSIVLFPQFKAKDYTAILDYQGASVTGGRQFTVSYGSSLPELPTNAELEHKIFKGWYTQPDCGGVQVADKYGLVPVVSILNENNFDLSGEYVYLYAGFETEKFTVTFCFESGMNTEDVQVEYNTPISEIMTSTRVDGKAVLTWSKTEGGEVWNGRVIEDMVLYAVEYAPVIEFDSNGGEAVSPVVARAGATVSLPTPTKELAKFLYWEDMSGNEYTSTTMPSASISLKAIWQAKIVFDENGGSDVNDISVAAGNSITLPAPEKEGYIFAGWYTAEKEQYTSTKMPSAGIALKAGWYKEKNVTKVIVNSGIYNFPDYYNKNAPEVLTEKLYINLSDVLEAGFSGTIYIDAHLSLKIGTTGNVFKLKYYSKEKMSTEYLLYDKTFEQTSKEFREFDYSMQFNLTGNIIYCSRYYTTNHSWCSISDYYVNVHYPDTTYLYL